MSKKSTLNIPNDAPIRARDIAVGMLVVRKRSASGVVLPVK